MKKSSSLLEILFREKVFVYAVLPFLISFSFFGIIVEGVKMISEFDSPYFFWYPIYFIFILPFSIYTNSSMFAGGKFLRSIYETVFEIFLLLLFNFVFLKGFSFGKNINQFLDINFGISVGFWIAMRLVNGHIVRLLNFPYEILVTSANAIASGASSDELFDEKYFEKRSIKYNVKSLFFTFFTMLIFVSLILVLSGSSVSSILYMVVFVSSCVMLIFNISKTYIFEDSFIKKIDLNNIDFVNKLSRFSLVFGIIVVVVSVFLSIGVYFTTKRISEVVNVSLRNKINEIISQEQKINEEEIKRIRERLMSESITNENILPRVSQPKSPRGFDWLLFWVFLQYAFIVLSLVIVIGFVLKKFFGVKDIPILSFFVKVYEIFEYFISKLFSFVRRLFSRRRKVFVVPPSLEDELISSFIISKEKVSKEKMEEIETIVRIFIDMLSYTSYIYPYKRSMGVEEYCEKLKEVLPDFSEHLDFISYTVNESRYSDHLLPKDIVENFKNKVGDIISHIKVRVKLVEDFRGG